MKSNPQNILARVRQIKLAQISVPTQNEDENKKTNASQHSKPLLSEVRNRKSISLQLQSGSIENVSTNWSSLKRFSNSPQVKSQLEIPKLKMNTERCINKQAAQRITDVNHHKSKKFALRPCEVYFTQPSQSQSSFSSESSLNNSEIEVIDEMRQIKEENQQELYHRDQIVISRLNDLAEIKSSEKKVQGGRISRVSLMKKQYQHLFQANSVEKIINNFEKDKTQQQFMLQMASNINPDDFERAKYLKDFKNGNTNLACISSRDYRTTIKSQTKLQDYAQYYKQNTNLYLQLNKSGIEQNIFHSGFGLLNDSNQINTVNATNQIRSQKKIAVFSEALLTKQCRTMKNLNLSSNNLSSQGLKLLFKNLPKYLTEIQLMNNNIDSKGCSILAEYIKTSKIQRLNLENNKFGDIGCNILCSMLEDNYYLTHLNLSRNNLTIFSAEQLSKLISKNSSIYELYLSFNSLNAKSGVKIWNSLIKNSTIKVFDIAYNQTASLECAKVMAKALVKHYQELLHVDISHNGFDEEQTQIIAKALDKNQNIYGFHFEGNYHKYSIDSRGFLVDSESLEQEKYKIIKQCQKKPRTSLKFIDNDNEKQEQEQPQITKKKKKQLNEVDQVHRFKKIDGLNPSQKLNDSIQDTDICWICDGWQEYKFIWTPTKSGSLNKSPIFIHFNFEGFAPILLFEENQQFYLYRMCPPNYKIQYFFSNPVEGIQTVAKNQMVTQTSHEDPINYESQQFLYNGRILIEGFCMKFVNQLVIDQKSLIFDKYMTKILCKPRELDQEFDLSDYKPIVTRNWGYEISIFKNYQPDNEQLVNECFEYDYSSSKIYKLLKENELPEIKELLRNWYPQIFSSFKYYASALIGATFPCITPNAIFDFLNQTKVIDSKFKSSDVDLNFISATNCKDTNYHNVYEKGLVRYQFLELLVRLAIDKYHRQGIYKTQVESVKQLFEQDLLYLRLSEVDRAQDWRDQRYWNEQCDMILKDRLPMLKLLFKYTAKLNPKQKFYKHTWIQSKDFRDLFMSADLFCESFVERDAYLAFLLGMQTQIDELFQQRHIQMEFYEFLESLARCAEKLSLIRTEEKMTISERRLEPLYKKLDALTLYLYLKLGESIKNIIGGGEDISEFDRCMLIKQQFFPSSIMYLFEDEEEESKLQKSKCYTIQQLKIEHQSLEEQVSQTIVANTSLRKQLSFASVIRQAQQQKNLRNNFNLTNVVSYFKQKEDERMRINSEMSQ